MKTVDGVDVVIGRYYYLATGQQVNLDSCAITIDGRDIFIVTPFYEGEAMSVSGDGGSHHEYSIEYEHEGDNILVTAIFDKAPLDKLCTKYRGKLEEIEKLSLTLGELLADKKKQDDTKRILIRGIAETESIYVLTSGKTKEAKEVLNSLDEEISEKRQRLSELEDSIGDMKSEDVSSLISKTELKRLNRRDFELQCLEEGGVDNWDWYDESLKNYRKRYPN